MKNAAGASGGGGAGVALGFGTGGGRDPAESSALGDGVGAPDGANAAKGSDTAGGLGGAGGLGATGGGAGGGAAVLPSSTTTGSPHELQKRASAGSSEAQLGHASRLLKAAGSGRVRCCPHEPQDADPCGSGAPQHGQ